MNGKLRKFLRGTPKKSSIFKDIIQIKVDPPPSHPIFDKSTFAKNHFFLMFWNWVDLPPSYLDNGFKYTVFLARASEGTSLYVLLRQSVS